MAEHPFCDGTLAAVPECKAWIPMGHPWHGCCLDPGHSGSHVCRCGQQWTTYRRRRKNK